MSYYSTRVVIQWHAENCDIVSSQRNSDVRNFVSTFVSQQHHWETVVAVAMKLSYKTSNGFRQVAAPCNEPITTCL